MLLRRSAAVAVIATLLVALGQLGNLRAANKPLTLAMHDREDMPGPPAAGKSGGHGTRGMPGMAQPGGAGPTSTAAPLDPMSRMMRRAGPQTALDHIEGRLAFLRAELRITGQQTAAWEQFAQALRSARQHLVEARDVLQVAGHDSHTPTERLEAYERHLAARLKAVRAARESFGRLYGFLDQSQRQTAAELVVPFVESF